MNTHPPSIFKRLARLVKPPMKKTGKPLKKPPEKPLASSGDSISAGDASWPFDLPQIKSDKHWRLSSGWMLAVPVLLLIVALPIILALACNLRLPVALLTGKSKSAPTGTPIIDVFDPSLPTAAPQPLALVDFQVQAPADTPPDEPVYLALLDEVTGLALNAISVPMQAEASLDGSIHSYKVTLPFPLGSLIRYRYERQSATSRAIEHVSNGDPVRYRLYHVEGPGGVVDIVSRWTDTAFSGPAGRIQGRAVDSASGAPIPNLLITAGGEQTLTTADGSFLLEGLTSGVHNLVGIAFDGSYLTFQQGANVAADSTTPAQLSLAAAKLINVLFVVQLPADTPPLVPVRLAGSLYSTGNTFANLAGGISSLATNMPVLESLPDGRYTLSLELPAGSDLRYKYTLGDGFWNAEHMSDGQFRLRQLIVPETDLIVNDQVETWHDGQHPAVTFDVTIPDSTPADDSVAIQLNPLFDWTEPLPMWSLGKDRWAYILYSPLYLPGSTLSYRYCRNGQCGSADAVETAGNSHTGLPLQLNGQSITQVDQVSAWVGLDQPVSAVDPPAEAAARSSEFMAGLEFAPTFRPSWRSRLPNILGKVQDLNANWLVLAPTWGWSRQSPPVIEPTAGSDLLWYDLVAFIEQSRQRGLNVALFPSPRFPTESDQWWAEARRDFAWWQVFFDHYRQFALHHADLASRTGAPALILGGDWLAPALPNGWLSDGSPSGVPADAEARWRNLLAEVRSRYNGRLLWATSLQGFTTPPPFLDAVDGIYLLFSAPLAYIDGLGVPEIQAEAGRVLDNQVLPLASNLNKPVVLGVAYPSATGSLGGCSPNPEGGCYNEEQLTMAGMNLPGLEVDLEAQDLAYRGLLGAVNERPWISGLISRGYYPPAALQDLSLSVHGKPAGQSLAAWFSRFLNGQ